MKIAVAIGVYNEEKNISNLIDSLLNQTRLPDEIIIVDDGSVDKTPALINQYVKKNSIIKYKAQKNSGPASARNTAWRNAISDICLFTDGDCIPDKNWIERITLPFDNERVGAVGGAYRTLNPDSILAKFTGMEIDWRYRDVKGEVDVHGSYNLAVRRHVLEEFGGFNEAYKKPSGEDWDLTYKISRVYKIVFVPEAVVGHFHPEDFLWYLGNQVQRGLDRVKIYLDHPDRRTGDTYTGKIIKYQVLASGLLIPCSLFFYPLFTGSFMIPISISLFLFLTTLIPFSYFFGKDKIVALYSIPVQLCRNFAWFIGMVKGVFAYGLKKNEKSE